MVFSRGVEAAQKLLCLQLLTVASLGCLCFVSGFSPGMCHVQPRYLSRLLRALCYWSWEDNHLWTYPLAQTMSLVYDYSCIYICLILKVNQDGESITIQTQIKLK